ncbi:MAG: hypothetical protein HON90_12900 [Halobacteriovoraceae bacterium]|jgi:hypothetical protein|nr:hypothetical protein [Halobacteriovoraceae bacterium]
MIKKLHFCESCRNEIVDITSILFVEDESDRGFCSKECIMKFYRPYMVKLEGEEAAFRKVLELDNEQQHLDLLANNHYINNTLKFPTETWIVTDELSKSFYTHILELSVNGQDLYLILICSYIESGPSFVFYKTITGSIDLVNMYRRDMKYSKVTDPVNAEDSQKIEIPNDVVEYVESKKSQLLALFVINRKVGDIQIDNFAMYDKYMQQTLLAPDEVYEYCDDDGDTLQNYIKSFKLGTASFFYVVIVYQHKDTDVTYAVPILGLPSVDEEGYAQFARGTKLNEVLNS